MASNCSKHRAAPPDRSMAGDRAPTSNVDTSNVDTTDQPPAGPSAQQQPPSNGRARHRTLSPATQDRIRAESDRQDQQDETDQLEMLDEDYEEQGEFAQYPSDATYPHDTVCEECGHVECDCDGGGDSEDSDFEDWAAKPEDDDDRDEMKRMLEEEDAADEEDKMEMLRGGYEDAKDQGKRKK